MPVLTVSGREPFPKLLINKDTIEEVVAYCINKLKLKPGDYKLLLEKNGAHSEEDSVLGALTPESELIIVPKDEEWHGRDFQSPISVTPSIRTSWTVLSGETPRGAQRRSSPTRSRDELSVPWSSFECVQGELESGFPLNPRSFRIIVHALANHLLAKKDYSRTSCKVLIKQVFDKHSDAFAIKDADGNLLSDGFTTFLTSLYERINFMKPPEMKKRRGSKRQLIDDEDDLSWQHQTNPTYDSYGCVAWQPQLPEGGSSSDQKRKKDRASVEDSPDTLTELMAQTYWLQRTDLNTRRGDLDEVLSSWPALKQTDHFLNHCSTLLGKNCAEVWYGSLHSQGHILFKYFDDYSATTKATSHNMNQLNSLKYFSQEANKAVSELRSKGPLIISAFMMTLSYFGENTESIIRLVDLIEDSEETIPATDRPLLLVKGRSLFDEGVQLLIVCEGKEVFRPNSLNEAFMLHFLSFYAFNYNYPEQGRKYLEFIQRAFFKINPKKGHKRGPKNARTDVLDPNVKKLIQKFDGFSQRLSRLMA